MRLKILLIFLIQLFCQDIILAQNNKITGSIKNGLSGEMISGAVVTLKETAFSAISRNNGSFVIDSVYEDKFVLNINAGGFQSYQSQIRIKEDVNLGTITLFPLGYEKENGALQKTIRATNIAELFVKRPNFIGGHAVYGIPPEPKRLIGNFYLDTKWNKASILLYRDQEIMEGYFVRYNISSNMFELRLEDSEEVTILPGLRVQNIVWIDSEHMVPRYFVNGYDFKEDGVPILGFFEVLVDGEMPLVRRTIASIKESNYNETLMIGNRDDRIMKKNTYYYIQGSDIIEIPRKKKKIFSIFGDKAHEMQKFANDNDVNLKDPASLFVLFTQYNSFFTGFEPIINKLTD